MRNNGFFSNFGFGKGKGCGLGRGFGRQDGTGPRGRMGMCPRVSLDRTEMLKLYKDYLQSELEIVNEELNKK